MGNSNSTDGVGQHAERASQYLQSREDIDTKFEQLVVRHIKLYTVIYQEIDFASIVSRNRFWVVKYIIRQ